MPLRLPTIRRKSAALPIPGGAGATVDSVYNSLLNLLPGSNIDWRKKAGDLWKNSAVSIGVNFICRTFPEAPPMVRRPGEGGKLQPVPGHKLTLKLKAPNDHWDGGTLWNAILVSCILSGNGYLHKVKAEAGNVLELNWLPHWLVEPVWPESGKPFISYYRYVVGDVEYHIPPADIVHFRYGIVDPENCRKHLSPLGALFREVASDNEASTYSAAMLANMGIPGVILKPPTTPEGAISLDPRDARRIKRDWFEKFGGDRRGEPYVLTSQMDVVRLAFSPSEMDLGAVRRLPEERIAAALGIPAIVLGFGAGLERATFANFKEAREATWESCIVPLQRSMATTIDLQLLPDFSTQDGEEFCFDLTEVRALQEDMNELYARAVLAYKSGMITRAAAKQMVGLSPDPGDEKYIYELMPQPAKAGDQQDPFNNSGGLKELPLIQTRSEFLNALQQVLREQ